MHRGEFHLAPNPQLVAIIGQNRKRKSEEVLLLRQWFSMLLCRYEYLTLHMVDADGHQSFQAVQVLDVERRNIVVRPFLDADDEAENEGLHTISIQPLEVWCGQSNPEHAGFLQTFVLVSPSKVDVISACGADRDCRKNVFAWQPRLSDVDGCVELHSPELLANRALDMMGAQTPVLSLLDALDRRGFTGVDEVVCHTAD